MQAEMPWEGQGKVEMHRRRERAAEQQRHGRRFSAALVALVSLREQVHVQKCCSLGKRKGHCGLRCWDTTCGKSPARSVEAADEKRKVRTVKGKIFQMDLSLKPYLGFSNLQLAVNLGCSGQSLRSFLENISG